MQSRFLKHLSKYNLLSTEQCRSRSKSTTDKATYTLTNEIQCDSFSTRPKKMRISQRLFIRFWICIYDYIPCFM